VSFLGNFLLEPCLIELEEGLVLIFMTESG